MQSKLKPVLWGCLFLFFIAGSAFGQTERAPDRKQNPLRMAGTFIAKVEGYYAKGIESSRKPLSFLASGDFDPEVYGMKLPFSFLASNQNFNYAQPFTRIGISPEYKWMRFHFGYRNISYSQYTLGGHSFLGAGLELNPGIFRFSALYGRFKKKTIPSTVNPLDTLIAPMRYGYAGKIGVGNENNYLDFTFLHIKDDTLSVVDADPGNFKSPQSNVVGGVNMKFTLMKSLVFEGETALSLLTRNLYAPGLNEVGFSGFENLARLLAVNISSGYAMAIRAALNYSTPQFSAGLEYRRVDPDFTSFGAYFFNTDLEHLTINTRFRLFEKKMNVRANFGLQNDNLKGNKVSRSAKIIAMLAMQYNSEKIFSMDASFSNYSINQQAGRLPLEDTIRLFQTNRSIGLMPRLTFAEKKNIQQVIQWNLTRTDLIDHNPFTADLTEVTSDIAMMNYLISFAPISFNVNTGISYIGMRNSIATRDNFVVMLGFNKSLFKNKLNVGVNGSGGLSIVNDIRGNVFNASCSVLLKAYKKHGVKFYLHFQNNKYPENSQQRSYQEFKTNVSYVYSI
ncbi:MAG: hypothetical protein C0593_08105 [Marinilabiliales bacterium]|nr:MAG: hypothetical protein C0593_08105 [Marinilabiliales bacterium]